MCIFSKLGSFKMLTPAKFKRPTYRNLKFYNVLPIEKVGLNDHLLSALCAKLPALHLLLRRQTKGRSGSVNCMENRIIQQSVHNTGHGS